MSSQVKPRDAEFASTTSIAIEGRFDDALAERCERSSHSDLEGPEIVSPGKNRVFVSHSVSGFAAAVKKSVTSALLSSLMFCELFGSAYAQSFSQDWKTAKQCPEYLPSAKACRVTIPLVDVSNGANPAPTHPDISIKPLGVAGVVLTNASPLMNCMINASPGPLMRDVSGSIMTFISSVGLFAGPVTGLAPAVELTQVDVRTLPGVAGDDGRQIDEQLNDNELSVKRISGDYQHAMDDFRSAAASVKTSWKYSYPDDASFATAAARMYDDLHKALEDQVPGEPDLQELKRSVDSTEKALDRFRTRYSNASSQLNPEDCHGSPTCLDRFRAWFDSATARLVNLKSSLKSFASQAERLAALKTTMNPAFTSLNSLSTPEGSGNFQSDMNHPWTTVYLPMSVYPEKQVTEVVTCRDVTTQAPTFDAITFTAYYESAASWDLSAAAFISFVPGRELGVVPGPGPITGPSVLAATNRSSIQLVPGMVFEFHPSHLNFRCPWARDGTGHHPWGYVCSLGPAGGLLINPNNATLTAEFFEGVSFGIHRLAVLVGNHTGRFQEFVGGQVGQTVPTGTMPATTRRWTNHLAIGISYRIPIR
jgi:hypothetical protein